MVRNIWFNDASTILFCHSSPTKSRKNYDCLHFIENENVTCNVVTRHWIFLDNICEDKFTRCNLTNFASLGLTWVAEETSWCIIEFKLISLWMTHRSQQVIRLLEIHHINRSGAIWQKPRKLLPSSHYIRVGDILIDHCKVIFTIARGKRRINFDRTTCAVWVRQVATTSHHIGVIKFIGRTWPTLVHFNEIARGKSWINFDRTTCIVWVQPFTTTSYHIGVIKFIGSTWPTLVHFNDIAVY